jgi:NADH-quinone oxidoreductase subunit E
MSVRRLDPVQPKTFVFTPENLAWSRETIAKYPPGKQASAVIPILWRVQEQNGGWVTKAAMETVAEMLDMSFIRVYEVATFYTMFQLSPVGRKAHVQVCGTTPCMLRGSEELMDVCRRRIHHQPHHLSADGDFSWEEVECLGACVNAPIVQVWSDTYEDLTPESFAKVLDGYAAGDPPKPGPQNGRQFSAPSGGLTTLLDQVVKTRSGEPRKTKLVALPDVAPSNAAKPVAAAIDTAPGLKTPAPVTAAGVAETAARAREIDRRARTTRAPIATAKRGAAAEIQPAKGDGAPRLLKKPKSGKGDDLKLIWGVGPKLEKMLNKMGVWHFDQVAAWSAKELAWADDRLEGFKGRAKRDRWISQAKKLAKGWRPKSGIGERPK